MLRKYKPTANELIIIRRTGLASLSKKEIGLLSNRLCELKAECPDLRQDIDNLLPRLPHLDIRYADEELKYLPGHIETGKYRPTIECLKAIKAVGYTKLTEADRDQLRDRLRQAEIAGGAIAKASEDLADEIDKADNAEISLDYDYINAHLD